ncbi:CheR family methyltransferase [Tistrella sp. BH-R2-4]|uniref:histidine kinase n=1 Tax=Tistrella arctica TaxID=3133430 RepID=A0ABU9YMU4_9PROT
MGTDRPTHLIVGIGASAGGIPAMEGFFKGMPQGSGLSFVVVTHLSPERESMLHQVIGHYTDLPVVIAAEGMLVEPDHVYVMPQNALLSIKGGRLTLRRLNVMQRERKPIDIFFSALAADMGERSVGVVLSGGDSDGTLGVKAIKERGGLTLAQVADGSGPRNPDMPQSAIASGLIDIAVPAEEMGGKLVEYARSFDLLDRLPVASGDTEDLTEAKNAIYAILRTQTSHDFSGYKTNTFMRRVKRRMQIVQAITMDAYVAQLQEKPEECMNLFRDLLINVTNFFRDGDAFDALASMVFPRLFKNRAATDTVRIWVPGCATGEEVYSIAILVREHLATLAAAPRVQIFATDIDDAALGVARAARYPETLLEHVSPERRERFFTSDGSSFVVDKEVRDLCVFSPHSVIRDPPFSRMDLISCRNLLIYLGPDVQNRVLPTFHYALKGGGYLFLGTSESVGQHGNLFVTLDKKQRLFQAREHVTAPRLPLLLGTGDPGSFGIAPLRRDGGLSPSMRQAVEAQVLERFAPAHVVVNGDGEVIYYSARTGRYLEAPQGAPSRQLISMARRGLRADLRAALREAIESGRAVVRENVAVDEADDRVQFITLTVEPLAGRGSGEPQFLVLFEPVGPAQTRAEALRGVDPNDTADLERELRDTRERLQSTIEEYETALEELKSSNEELVSVNEEAQSTNEELEASKEEMQSLNEELNTINAELTEKVEELDRANTDLKNLFESTRIATIFLDRDLVIRTFTPAASSFFNLRMADIGRPLTDLASQLDYPDLKRHISAVFSSGEMIEHQLARDESGAHYLVRLIPYRGSDNRISGVVVTFVDVTTLAEAQDHQSVLISELNHRVKNMLAVVISIANRTLESAPDPKAFSEALIGRLHAMARAYGLLSRKSWSEVAMEDLIRQEMDPFGPDRTVTEGPVIRLKPEQGLSLGMVIHELATNAAKYGALSIHGGRVEITWSADQEHVHLNWAERDGPRVGSPEETGFGLRLVKGEIGYRLGGTVETFFAPDGLKVVISFPLT